MIMEWAQPSYPRYTSNLVASISFLRCDTLYSTLLTDVVLHPSMPSVLGLAPRGYKIMCVRHVFSSSLLALRYWVLDSTCAFPFTFNPLTITLLPSPIFLAHFHLFWTFFLTTEHIERSHRKLFNHQYHQHVQQKCVDTS